MRYVRRASGDVDGPAGSGWVRVEREGSSVSFDVRMFPFGQSIHSLLSIPSPERIMHMAALAAARLTRPSALHALAPLRLASCSSLIARTGPSTALNHRLDGSHRRRLHQAAPLAHENPLVRTLQPTYR